VLFRLDKQESTGKSKEAEKRRSKEAEKQKAEKRRSKEAEKYKTKAGQSRKAGKHTSKTIIPKCIRHILGGALASLYEVLCFEQKPFTKSQKLFTKFSETIH